jgi:hypothetical protein
MFKITNTTSPPASIGAYFTTYPDQGGFAFMNLVSDTWCAPAKRPRRRRRARSPPPKLTRLHAPRAVANRLLVTRPLPKLAVTPHP